MSARFHLPILALALLSACGQPTLNLTGDGSAVGARIEVDGKDAGEMEKRVYSRRSSKVMKPGQVYAAAKIRLPAGTHDVKVTAKDGRSFSARLDVAGEAALGVDFEKGSLEN